MNIRLLCNRFKSSFFATSFQSPVVNSSVLRCQLHPLTSQRPQYLQRRLQHTDHAHHRHLRHHHPPPPVKLDDVLDEWKGFRPTPLNINTWVQWSRRPLHEIELESFMFLAHELLIRITQIMLTLRSLAPEVRCSSPYQILEDNYCRTLLELQPFARDRLPSLKADSPGTAALLKSFTEALQVIHRRHATLVIQLSYAAIEWKEREPAAFEQAQDALNRSLDRIFLLRIGVRALISHHIALFSQPSPDRWKWAGVIDVQCQASQVVRDAVEDARFLAQQVCGEAPKAKIVGSALSLDTRFPYIPSHLYHIVFELTKNAMRATIDASQEAFDLGSSFPQVTVVLSKGDSDLTIKISDVGGGISRTNISRVFDYSWTTASRPAETVNSDMVHAPMAGFGYGLPLSRQYARYLGGDVQLISMDGYGTDAYVYLKHVASDTIECVPPATIV